MRIVSIKPIKAHRVTTDEPDYHEYTRYAPDSWTVTMGESDESVYDCAELEKEFQKFLKDKDQP